MIQFWTAEHARGGPRDHQQAGAAKPRADGVGRIGRERDRVGAIS